MATTKKKAAPKKRVFVRKADTDKKTTRKTPVRKVVKKEPELQLEELKVTEQKETLPIENTPYSMHVHSQSEVPSSGEQVNPSPNPVSGTEPSEVVNPTEPSQTIPAPVSQPESQPVVETTQIPLVADVQSAPTKPEDASVVPVNSETPSAQANPPTPASVEQTQPAAPAVVLNESSGYETQHKKSFRKIFIFILVLILLLGLLGVLLFSAYTMSKNKTVSIVRPHGVANTPTSMPSPTAGKSVEKDAYSIAILNGSGIGGEAGRAKATLVDAGYEVSSVGNATSSAFTDTVIQANPKVINTWVTDLKTLLKETYRTVNVEALDASKSAQDVVVILGSDKK